MPTIEIPRCRGSLRTSRPRMRGASENPAGRLRGCPSGNDRKCRPQPFRTTVRPPRGCRRPGRHSRRERRWRPLAPPRGHRRHPRRSGPAGHPAPACGHGCRPRHRDADRRVCAATASATGGGASRKTLPSSVSTTSLHTVRTIRTAPCHPPCNNTFGVSSDRASTPLSPP